MGNMEEANTHKELTKKLDDLEKEDNDTVKMKKRIKISLKMFIIIVTITVIIIISIVFCLHNIYNERMKIKLSRNIYNSISFIDDVKDDELCKRLDIDKIDLKSIEDMYMESKDRFFSNGSFSYQLYIQSLSQLEHYILNSNDNYTILIYDNMKKLLDDDKYARWYSHLISGIINYHLGGSITDSSWKVNSSSSNKIIIDDMYSIYLDKIDNYGGIRFKIILENEKFDICKEYDFTSDRFNEVTDTSEVAKPIIYIYPKKETNVSVKLGNSEYLTCTYPKYTDEWNVKSEPNGNLEDLDTGRKLYSLYWEGICPKEYNYENAKEGFIIEGEKTAEFLEEKLEILGLNEREAEEFIVYWLPQMEKNKYNYIRFETKEEIDKEMPLEIEPKPDTIIRVLMDWKALGEKIEIKEQKLEKANREGFTVVEWGGSILNESILK